MDRRPGVAVGVGRDANVVPAVDVIRLDDTQLGDDASR